MDNLPAWALWIITAGVGLSPVLALLLVRPIARPLHRVLWPRPEAATRSEREAVDGEAAGVPTPPL